MVNRGERKRMTKQERFKKMLNNSVLNSTATKKRAQLSSANKMKTTYKRRTTNCSNNNSNNNNNNNNNKIILKRKIMAKVLKFLIFQRNSLRNYIRKENSWRFLNDDEAIYDNNNKNDNDSNQNSINTRKSIDSIPCEKQQQQRQGNEKYYNTREHDTKEDRICSDNKNSKYNKQQHEDENQYHAKRQQHQQQRQQQHQQQPQKHQQKQQKLTASHQTQECFISIEAARTSASAAASYSVSSYAYVRMTNALTLKRKMHLNKLLEVHSHDDSRTRHKTSKSSSSSGSISIAVGSLDECRFYLTLLVAFYCVCVFLIHASSAASTTVHNISNILQAEGVDISLNTTAANSNNVATMMMMTTTTTTTSNPPADSAQLFDEAADKKDEINSNSHMNNINSSVNNNNNNDTSFNLRMSAAANQLHQRLERDAANVPDEEDDSSYHDDEYDEYEALINNKSAKGKYIGAPCDNNKCESTLLHVLCDKETQLCGCERNYPVQLGLTKGCAKPKKLGDQCFYDETCIYSDENSLCVQVKHNALCQCASGFHSVSYAKPTRRVFCTQDLKELKSDLPTLLGVSTGIAVLAGLICMVLHLFSKTKYPRHRNFGDANLPPPIIYSSETGIPLTVQSGRPSSRSSLRSSGSIGSYGNRRFSTTMQSSSGHVAGGGVGGSAGSKGILVSTSRTGAARSAAILLISCHISELSKQNTRQNSRQTSGAGGSLNSRDTLEGDRNSGDGGGNTDSGTRSCDSALSMTRHLQRQLQHQRQLLSLELSPAKTKNHNKIRTMLGINGIDNYRTDDDDLNSLDNGSTLQIGALPTPASDTPRFAVLEDQV